MRLSITHLACLIACFALLSGCTHHHSLSDRNISPLRTYDGQARSLALSTPVVRVLDQTPAGYEPWYTDRNDYGPSVFGGVMTYQYEESVTYTRDSQHTSHGRVRDRYDSTTYTETYRGMAR